VTSCTVVTVLVGMLKVAIVCPAGTVIVVGGVEAELLDDTLTT